MLCAGEGAGSVPSDEVGRVGGSVQGPDCGESVCGNGVTRLVCAIEGGVSPFLCTSYRHQPFVAARYVLLFIVMDLASFFQEPLLSGRFEPIFKEYLRRRPSRPPLVERNV